MTKGRDRMFKLGRIVTADVQRVAEGNCLLHPGESRGVARPASSRSRPAHRPCRQSDMRDYFVDRAVARAICRMEM